MMMDEVLRAARRLAPVLSQTPAVWSEARGAWLKLESLQATGSFKVRGALNAVAAGVERGDRRPVAAASAGNHGRGVAWAARRFGLRAHVVVPLGAPASKVEGCRALGAEVIGHGECYDEAEAYARQVSERMGWRFVHPFDDPEVIAGQGTVALELASLEPDAVVAPVGGGGLAAGMAAVLPGRVVGAQVEGVDAMRRALNGGVPERFEPARTLADGLRVRRPGALTRQMCAGRLRGIVTVSEGAVRAAVVELMMQEKVAVEGAGAVAVAALPKVEGERRVAVVSGGNVDRAVFAELLGAAPWSA